MKVLLFSGGIESTCLAYQLRPQILLTIDYGQKARIGEINRAAYLANKMQLEHVVITTDISAIGHGVLSETSVINGDFQPEYWPLRNQMLITFAAMKYAHTSIDEIVIGTVATDSVHPDGNMEFINKINCLLHVQNLNLTVSAPAANKTSLQLIEESKIPFDILGWTFSCHVSDIPCGQCSGCTKTIGIYKLLGHFSG